MNKIAKLFNFFLSIFSQEKQISEGQLVCLAQLRDGAEPIQPPKRKSTSFMTHDLMRYRYHHSHGDENCSSVTL